MTTKADRVRRLAHDIWVHMSEYDRLPAGPEAPTLSQYLAEQIVADEIERARITGQTPAWALEPRT